MKVIIDTNELVSAALKDRKLEQVILHVASNQDYKWIVSSEILTEYQEVLNRPRLNLNADRRDRFLQLIQTLTQSVEVTTSVDFPRDPKDAKFLECAISANVEYLITGDRDFAASPPLSSTQTISVSQFLQLIEVNGEDEA